MMEPVSDAFTSEINPRRRAKIAMISSAAFPNVAFSSPPSPGPIRAAACSVARPIQAASGSSEIAEAVRETQSGASRSRAATAAGRPSSRKFMTRRTARRS